jgi:hypothetical protein
VSRIGRNTFYDRKNKILMKIPELKMSGTGLIAEFPGIPNGFPNQDDVDLYNTRKSYAVIESLDLMSNIS